MNEIYKLSEQYRKLQSSEDDIEKLREILRIIPDYAINDNDAIVVRTKGTKFHLRNGRITNDVGVHQPIEEILKSVSIATITKLVVRQLKDKVKKEEERVKNIK